MRKSLKAALLSALVFPGAGHFFLKSYLAGILLLGSSVAVLYLMISAMVERALAIVEVIESGEIPPSVAAIMELVTRQPTASDASLLSTSSTVLLLVWLIGIVDSYRVGRDQEKVSGLG